MSFACAIFKEDLLQHKTLRVLNSMTAILDVIRQKVREILDIYPVPDVEDVAFKQRIFEIFKEGSKAFPSPSRPIDG
jgi:hypothetical protein